MVYEDAKIILNQKSSVFFGINGAGKSSLLRAINLLYANIINGVVNRKELRQQYQIDLKDIRYGKAETKITGRFVMRDNDEDEIEYERSMVRRTGRRSHTKQNLDEIVSVIQGEYQPDSDSGSVPVFANYGTNRLVLDIPLRIRTRHEFDIYSAYEKAIETRIDFRTFFEWYRNQEDEENAVKVESKNLGYEDRALKAVRTAILAMLPELGHLHIARRPRLAMVVRKDGMNLNVSGLSDGEKCSLAMMGDLARRLTIANPRMTNPLMGTGVVLIDEIELHMHPSWQRRILKVLKETFPNIQFIITTHSPQVLGEVDDSYNVFSLRTNGNNDTYIVQEKRLDAFDANYILEEYMSTASRSEAINALISETNKKIQQKNYIDAERLLEEMRIIAGDIDKEYILAMEYLRRSRLRDAKN